MRATSSSAIACSAAFLVPLSSARQRARAAARAATQTSATVDAVVTAMRAKGTAATRSVEHEVVAVHGLLGRRAAAARARAPTSPLRPGAARRRRSCEIPLPIVAAVADDLDRVAGVERAAHFDDPDRQQRLVPPSRSARAAPSSTTIVPCVGFAYLSQSLNDE